MLLLHLHESVTWVAIEIHNVFRIWETSIESRNTTGSLWIFLPFTKDCAV
jgi:hypothetical protein